MIGSSALATGCGGGGSVGGSSSPTSTSSKTTTTDTASSGPYSPNYRTEIIALRRWTKSVVTVNFTPPLADSTGVVRDVQPLISQAISMWNAKVGNVITMQLVSDSTADVNISFVPTNTLPDGAIGRTEVTFRNADQVLLTANVRVDQSMSDDLETQVLTHELGHALGIEGHSANDGDLMFARAHLPAGITVRDENTILLAYNGGSSASSTGDAAASSSLPSSTRVAHASKDSGIGTAEYVCAAQRP